MQEVALLAAMLCGIVLGGIVIALGVELIVDIVLHQIEKWQNRE